MDWHIFEEEEKELLRRSWNILEPVKQAVACDIYDMIFNQCPEARRLFPKMKFSTSKKEKKSNEFIFQALRFMQVIEGGVRALDHLESLDNILDNLGRRHGKLEVNGKFQPHYWSTFIEATIFCIRKTLTDKNFNQIDGVIILWRVLLSDIIKKIKVGYNADIAIRMSHLSCSEKNSPSHVSL